ncbi:unnamed protein product [Medioppia subpectinata]|uniref:F-box domain-containing protein n=1 Tax=Medioppia subpectinata TaxID=1979941 RepID=A0A7R9KRV6_9ACAR|nr:unnamed protein product [Medioppia subpectinata]CAG2108600.1 unnamed protein product [Medioppia subpectinata]
MAQQTKHKKTSLETTDDGNEDNKQQPQMYAKDTLGRFGDDLSALIVSYLSLEDRIRLECVSKQFQRTVFGSVVDITLSDELMQRLLTNGKTINTQLLATIAIKCPNIETIDCRGMRSYIAYIPRAIKTFRDNCHNLRDIYCNVSKMSGQTMHTLWPMITRIGYKTFDDNTSDDKTSDDAYRQALTHCHRLSKLVVNGLLSVFKSTSGPLLAKNLLKCQLNYYSNYYNTRHLSAFVAHNQSLRSLDIKYIEYKNNKSLMEMCGQLSRLTQLRELRLGLDVMTDDDLIADFLHTIGVNCKLLKRLSLELFSTQKQINVQTLDSLRYYRQLKRLDLRFNATADEIALYPLRHCRRLTRLDIHFRRMNANVLTIVRKSCPQLQYLCIHEAYSLSHIPPLQEIYYSVLIESQPKTDLSDNDLNAMLSSSPKLKTIEIRVNNEKKFYSK